MRVGKIIAIGTSLAVVIPTKHLNRLGWMRGDAIEQRVEDERVILENVHRRSIKPMYSTAEYGDHLRRRP